MNGPRKRRKKVVPKSGSLKKRHFLAPQTDDFAGSIKRLDERREQLAGQRKKMLLRGRTRALRHQPQDALPVTLTSAGIGLLLAVLNPGGLSGGEGFVIGLGVGILVAVINSITRSISDGGENRPFRSKAPI